MANARTLDPLNSYTLTHTTKATDSVLAAMNMRTAPPNTRAAAQAAVAELLAAAFQAGARHSADLAPELLRRAVGVISDLERTRRDAAEVLDAYAGLGGPTCQKTYRTLATGTVVPCELHVNHVGGCGRLP